MTPEELEEKIRKMYAQTAVEVNNDLNKFLGAYKVKDEAQRKLLQKGEITEDQYKSWREGQIFMDGQMRAKMEDVAQRMVHADEQAMSMVNDQLPEIYATNYNWAGYNAENSANKNGFDYTEFTVINQDAVKELSMNDPDLIPWKPMPDVDEDLRWNRQHIQNAIRQGIVKGDSMDKIADRLLPVVNMDANAAMRTARTAVNGVENKGRVDACERVSEAGIPMVQVWSCTHDSRTRDTHIMMDGEEIEVGGVFSNGLRYPGDPAGDPSEVYNCRCRMNTFIKGMDHSNDDQGYEEMMKGDDEYYNDWLRFKEDQQSKENVFQEKKDIISGKVSENTVPEISWKTASNREEANELLSDIGFTKVSPGFKQMDEKLYVDQVNRLSELNAKFGAIPEDGMEFIYKKDTANAFVTVDIGNGKVEGLTLSKNAYGGGYDSLVESKKNSIDRNWSMPCSDDKLSVYTVTHEYGHILENQMMFTDDYKDMLKGFEDNFRNLMNNGDMTGALSVLDERKKYVRDYSRETPKQYKDEIIGIAKDKNPDYNVLDGISDYGKTNSEEFFAEVFANSQCGNPNELGDAMNEWLRRKGYDT